MSELLIGTQSGVFRLGNDENLQPEEGPATVAFLTRAHEGAVALTQQGALWRRISRNNSDSTGECHRPCCIGVTTAGRAGRRARPYAAFRATSAGPSRHRRISRMCGPWSQTRRS